jgi:hypothetical protein
MRQRTDYPTFSDQELESRHKAVYQLMEQEGVVAALIEPVYLMQSGYAGIHVMSSMPMREPDFAVPEMGSPISREA